MEYVILGNGIAGVCAAETIRQFDAEGGITMVADETFTPYSRPMISMVLAGQVSLGQTAHPKQPLLRRPENYCCAGKPGFRISMWIKNG